MKAEASSPVYVALIHHPVYNKHREVVRTCLTPLDLHDIARVGRTYGVRGFYCVSALATQMELAQMICDHWTSGWGAGYNPNRKEALSIARIVPDLDLAREEIEREWGRPPRPVATSARIESPDLGWRELRERVRTGEEAFLLLFGTGWGLLEDTVKAADYRLDPIVGPTGYNHLSVRSAVSIILDRILGVWSEAGNRAGDGSTMHVSDTKPTGRRTR